MFVVLFLFLNTMLFSEVEIYDTMGNKVEAKEIEKKFQQAQVLILGEEHNDKTGHEWKLSFIQSLAPNVQFSISFEMLERDQQIIINEYIQGLYDEAMFRENMRLWNNWNDYHPILEFAKKSHIGVLAANPPRRYVRAISKKGIEVWKEFPSLAYLYLPNLELVQKFRDKEYETKFMNAMQGAHSQNIENFLLAQHIWDESMAEVIAREVTNYKNKVIHINGRFHSDNFMGVSFRLKSKNIKVVTVSIVPQSNIKNETEFKGLADFIVLTKP